MPSAPLPANEQARLATLHRYQILDSEREAEYDDLTRIAAQVCGTPIALISLIDSERQWFKSRIGIDAAETPRDQAFCAYAIHETSTLVVPDAQQDQRFADNALVLGDPHIRFYAGAPLQTADGMSIGTLCVIDRENRTLSASQQEALEALARQVVRLIELRYRTGMLTSLVDMNPAAMFVKDAGGRFAFVNDAWNEHFGRRGEDPVGQTAAEWFGMETGAKLLEDDIDVLRSAQRLETIDTIPSNSGEGTWLTVRFPIRGAGGSTMAGGVRLEITRTLRAERRLRESEQKFAKLCVASPDAIVSGDAEARVVYWNRAAEVMFGYGEEEMAGQPWSLLLAPEDRERFADAERWMRRRTREFTGLRKDGSLFPAEVSLAAWRAEGSEFHTCFVRDLTARRTIESQLEQARRVESLGMVAATVAHEFNNVLMAIGPFNSVITRVAGHDERVQAATAAIQRGIRRAKSIVDQILLYARAHEPVRKPVDLAAWVAGLREELGSIAGEGVTLRLEVPPQPAMVSCDVRQLEQVLANLVGNARDAMEGNGVLTVSLEIRDYCPDALLRDGERCARLTVADTGVGMSESTLSRIFEPLFTTKSHGTGIGLALAQRLVERHGGVLVAHSEEGRGSELVVHLPLLM
ncbi:MAG TPA: PAS domain S-box protein [Thermoanaerobaculia bacterium]|jgi:PAS domain S-box-containing protein